MKTKTYPIVKLDGEYFLIDKKGKELYSFTMNEYYIEQTQVKPDKYVLFKADSDLENSGHTKEGYVPIIENCYRIVASTKSIDVPYIAKAHFNKNKLPISLTIEMEEVFVAFNEQRYGTAKGDEEGYFHPVPKTDSMDRIQVLKVNHKPKTK